MNFDDGSFYTHFCYAKSSKKGSYLFSVDKKFFRRTAFFGRFGMAKGGIGISVVEFHCEGYDLQVCTVLRLRETSSFVFSTST